MSGYPGFDQFVHTSLGSPLFVGPDFTVRLSPEFDHLDPQTYPDDLMNPELDPSERKLPSPLDVRLIAAVQGVVGSAPHGLPTASLVVSDSADPNLGWAVRGAGSVQGNTVVLNEDERVFTRLSRTLVVP